MDTKMECGQCNGVWTLEWSVNVEWRMDSC